MTDEETVKYHMKVLKSLADMRQPYEAMIDEIIRFVNHGRRLIKDTDNRGEKTGIDVYDGTAMAAATLASNGIHGHLCSSSIHWFDFTLPGKFNFARTSDMRQWNGKRLDEYPEVQEWLNDSEEVMYAAYLRSNFYNANPVFVREGMTIGTATTYIEEDEGNSKTIFTMPHFREIYFSENRFGYVDTRYRKYKLTLSQLVDKFTKEKISGVIDNFDQKFNNNPYEEVEVVHATYPRKNFDSSKLNGANRKIASVWLLMSPQKLIQEDGYYDDPGITWRWRKNNDELCGRSPAWDAYVDIAKGNQIAKTNLQAAHRMVDPAIIGPSDLRGKLHKDPGGYTGIDPGLMQKELFPRPLMTGIQVPFAIEQQERADKSIREHFFVDYFLMLNRAAFDKVDLTATQVVGMQAEQAAVLGTQIGQYQSEGLDPIMDRMYEIELRGGRIPEPPEIMIELAGGQRIEIDYLGPLAQAQRKLFKISGIRASIDIATVIGNAYQPAMDKVDWDEMMVQGLEAAGAPPSVIRTDESVAAIREQRQQAEEADKEAQQMIEGAKAMPGAGKAIEPESPADFMLKGLGGKGVEGTA